MNNKVTLYPGKYYVYEWLDKNGECLYIGKGTEGRAWVLCGHANKKIKIEEVRTVRLLLWVDSNQDALDYERKLMVLRNPKWNMMAGQRSWRNDTEELLKLMRVGMPKSEEEERALLKQMEIDKAEIRARRAKL
jgi:hypothetical protein